MAFANLKITKRRQDFLEKMGIHTIQDLLKTYPTRYEQVEALPFEQWEINQAVSFEGLICSSARVIYFSKKRSMTKFKVLSWNEEVEVTLFNRPWTSQFSFGKKISLFGIYKGQNKVTASNYNFQSLSEQIGMHPVYSLPQGFRQKEFQDL